MSIAFLKNIFSSSPEIDLKDLIKKGAQIIDVRTKAEYEQGHVKGSINIALNNLANHYAKLNKDTPIITCCASGVRSAQAKNILKSNGFKEVYNGGSWTNLK